MLFSENLVQDRRKIQKVGYLGCVFLWRRGNSRDNCLLWSKSVLLIDFFFNDLSNRSVLALLFLFYIIDLLLGGDNMI